VESEDEKKPGVFISHVSDEAAAAAKLKSLIRQVFGRDFSVFVSSDYVSIPGGEPWFAKIVQSLKSVEVVLVLISEHSSDSRWINFEAGLGIGAEAEVIPIVFRSFDKGDVGLPLSELQVRSLHDPRDVRALLDDLAHQMGLKARTVDEELFVEELQEVEKGLPSKGVQLVPFLEYQDHETIQLKFNLVNVGNKDIELIQLWTVIPNSIQKRDWSAMPVPPALMVDEQSLW
jgi:hypothetical protein